MSYWYPSLPRMWKTNISGISRWRLNAVWNIIVLVSCGRYRSNIWTPSSIQRFIQDLFLLFLLLINPQSTPTHMAMHIWSYNMCISHPCGGKNAFFFSFSFLFSFPLTAAFHSTFFHLLYNNHHLLQFLISHPHRWAQSVFSHNAWRLEEGVR